MNTIIKNIFGFLNDADVKAVLRKLSVLFTISNACGALLLLIVSSFLISNTIISNIVIVYDVLCLIFVQLVIAHSFD